MGRQSCETSLKDPMPCRCRAAAANRISIGLHPSPTHPKRHRRWGEACMSCLRPHNDHRRASHSFPPGGLALVRRLPPTSWPVPSNRENPRYIPKNLPAPLIWRVPPSIPLEYPCSPQTMPDCCPAFLPCLPESYRKIRQEPQPLFPDIGLLCCLKLRKCAP